jgi:hypothetical protein
MGASKLLLEKVEALQDLLVAIATSSSSAVDTDIFLSLREELMAKPEVKRQLPQMVVNCRTPTQFWHFIKNKYPTYEQRRQYIWGEFRPTIEGLEHAESDVTSQLVADTLDQLDVEHVQAIWAHALENRTVNPEGAITAARTLLESVCRIILEDLQVTPADDWDLPRLYRATAERLNLAPTQHTEQVFKQILGSCQQVVEGLGGLRNKLGDAHGQGRHPVKPAPRHAELAVNLAGAMATFLVQTWEYSNDQRAPLHPPNEER